MREIRCEYCEARYTDAPVVLYTINTHDGTTMILCEGCVDLCIHRPTQCTFCGWADPISHFVYHTPGGAPVCTACAEEGILNLPEEERLYEQGEGNYQSGTPRVVRDSKVLFPKTEEEN